jgi:hypothetical protein
MPTTEKLRNKLMAKLTELFQLDQPDPELLEDQHTKLVVDGKIRLVANPTPEEAKGLWKFRRIEGWIPAANNLPNLKKDDENWKVRLIEEEFHKKMWEVE